MTGLYSLNPEPDAPTIVESMSDENPIEEDFKVPFFLSKCGRAWWHSIERLFDLVATLIKLLPQLLQDDAPGSTAKRRVAPHVPFNCPVDVDRVVGHVRVDMKKLHILVKKHSCTINDIALCVVAGALGTVLM